MPVAVVVGCGLGTSISRAEAVCGLVISCGGLLLLAQIARDAGKRKERSLFQKWGGTPSVCIFRHVDARMDAITKARCHKTMSNLVKEAKAPSADEETADPIAADGVYTAWSTYIRVNTRDTKNAPAFPGEHQLWVSPKCVGSKASRPRSHFCFPGWRTGLALFEV